MICCHSATSVPCLWPEIPFYEGIVYIHIYTYAYGSQRPTPLTALSTFIPTSYCTEMVKLRVMLCGCSCGR